MSIFPLGVLVAITAMFLSIQHLGQTPGNYLDYVALLVVLGGTLSVGVVLLPWSFHKDIFRAFRDLVLGSGTNSKKVLEDCLAIARDRPSKLEASLKYLHQQILKDGLELIQLNFEKEKVIVILQERMSHYLKRRKKVANSIRSLAKYPPAFGLMGTVIGLVNVMRGVSTGIDGKQTALEMAIALIATMYGLLVSNLILNPAGELILKRIAEEESYGELAISTISLLMDQVSLLESQELLNSYVPLESRVSLIDSLSEAV